MLKVHLFEVLWLAPSDYSYDVACGLWTHFRFPWLVLNFLSPLCFQEKTFATTILDCRGSRFIKLFSHRLPNGIISGHLLFVQSFAYVGTCFSKISSFFHYAEQKISQYRHGFLLKKRLLLSPCLYYTIPCLIEVLNIWNVCTLSTELFIYLLLNIWPKETCTFLIYML